MERGLALGVRCPAFSFEDPCDLRACVISDMLLLGASLTRTLHAARPTTA
jgi:hypothetical protein